MRNGSKPERPADAVIRILGGTVRAAAQALDMPHTTVHGWRHGDGLIPTHQQEQVYKTVKRRKKSFTRKDLLGF